MNSPVMDIGITLASQIGFVVVGIVLIAVFLGIWLDKTLGTKPIFTILLLMGSGPISMYLVLRIAKSALSKINQFSTRSTHGSQTRDEGGQEE